MRIKPKPVVLNQLGDAGNVGDDGGHATADRFDYRHGLVFGSTGGDKRQGMVDQSTGDQLRVWNAAEHLDVVVETPLVDLRQVAPLRGSIPHDNQARLRILLGDEQHGINEFIHRLLLPQPPHEDKSVVVMEGVTLPEFREGGVRLEPVHVNAVGNVAHIGIGEVGPQLVTHHHTGAGVDSGPTHVEPVVGPGDRLDHWNHQRGAKHILDVTGFMEHRMEGVDHWDPQVAGGADRCPGEQPGTGDMHHVDPLPAKRHLHGTVPGKDVTHAGVPPVVPALEVPHRNTPVHQGFLVRLPRRRKEHHFVPLVHEVFREVHGRGDNPVYRGIKNFKDDRNFHLSESNRRGHHPLEIKRPGRLQI